MGADQIDAMMKRLLLPLFALLLSLALPAGASPDLAAGLKDALTRRLAESAVSRDSLHVERVPDVAVTPDAGGSYHLRIPKLRLASGDGWLVEVPLIEGEASPQPDGSWQLRARLPQPLTLYGGNGFRLGDISLGRQSLSLRISGDGRSLLAADIDLGDARFLPVMGAGTGALSALRLVLIPKSQVGDVWSGRISLGMDGLMLKDPVGVERIALKRLRLDGTADGLDMRRMGELLATGDRAALDRIARTADLAADVAGLRYVGDDGGRLALTSGKGKLVLTGLSAPKAALALDWKHDGLERSGPGISPDLLPNRADVTLTAQALPRALLSAPRPADGWTPLLAAAGSTVKLSRLSLWTPGSTILGNGDFRFSRLSPQGVAGDADLSLRGVDRLINGVNQTMGARGAGIGIGLYALQGVGKVQAGPEGTTHQYRLTIAPDGTVTLNGTNATGLFRGLMAMN